MDAVDVAMITKERCDVDEVRYLRFQVDLLGDSINHLYMLTAPKVWFESAFKSTGVRIKLLPWIGSDGSHSGDMYRKTLVIPVLGLFFIVIGGKWRWTEVWNDKAFS